MEKLIELEDRSLRNNLRIDGISEVSHETWEMCEDSVKDLIKTKLEINDEIEIARCRFLRFKGQAKDSLKCKEVKKHRNLLTVCFYHVTYAFQSESTLYSCLNVKELLARSRREI